MKTPEEYAVQVLRDYRHETGGVMRDPLFVGRAVAAIRAAINDKLGEVAVELDKLAEGHYTSAQTPAGLVRAMKEG